MENTLLACSVKPNTQYMWAYQALIPSVTLRFNSTLVLGCQHQFVPDMTKSIRGEPPHQHTCNIFLVLGAKVNLTDLGM